MTGCNFRAKAVADVDEEGIRDLDELQYDYTRIEGSHFGFTLTIVFTATVEQVMEHVDVHVTAGGIE